MNLLVTGGSGLVGSAITADFKPDRDELDLMELDSIIDYIDENEITHIILGVDAAGCIGDHHGFDAEHPSQPHIERNLLHGPSLIEVNPAAKHHRFHPADLADL